MHHTAAYAASLAAVTDSDVTAMVDQVIQSRNSHLIFSEDFNLIAAYANGSLLSRMRFGNVGLNYRGQNHLWPLSVSTTVEGRPQIIDYTDYPLPLPKNEEITLLATTTGAGPTVNNVILFLAKPDWNINQPRGDNKLIVRATSVVVAGSTTTWTATAGLTFERDLFNGVYAVTGASVVAANAQAFRLYFPSMRPVNGRQLRPGGLIQNTAALPPWPVQMSGLGEWGRFHTFEPPSLQVAGDAAGGTYEVRLALTYLGQDERLLQMGP